MGDLLLFQVPSRVVTYLGEMVRPNHIPLVAVAWLVEIAGKPHLVPQ